MLEVVPQKETFMFVSCQTSFLNFGSILVLPILNTAVMPDAGMLCGVVIDF